MKRSFCPSLVLTAALVLTGCSAAPDGAPSTAGATGRSLGYEPGQVQPIDTTDSSDYAPLKDDALQRARLPLERVVSQLERPAFLDDKPLASDAPPPLQAEIAYAKGRSAVRQGDIAEAKQQLAMAERLAPGQVEVQRLLGRLYGATGNVAQAQNHYEQAARLRADDLESLAMLGRYALEQGRHERAIAIFAEADRVLAGEKPRRWAVQALVDYHLAIALAKSGYAAAALDRLRSYVQAPRDRFNPDAWSRQVSVIDRQAASSQLLLGDLHMRLDQPAAALQAWAAAADDSERISAALVRRLAYAYLRTGQPGKAIDLALQQVSADEPDAGLRLVSYLARQGLDARLLTDKLRGLYGEEGSTPLALAVADLLPRDQAAALLREHLASDPSAGEAFSRLITLTLGGDGSDASIEQVTEALQLTAQAMAASPEQARVYAALTLTRLGQLSRAREAIATLPAEARRQPMMRVIEALSLASDQQVDEAVALLREALASDPQSQPVRVELVQLLMAQGKHEQAEDALGPLEGSRDPDVVRLQVRVLSQAGRTAEALERLDQMMAGPAPAPAELHIEKALLQLKEGSRDAAEQTLLDALNVYPDSQAIFATLFEIYDQTNDARKWSVLMRRLLGAIPDSRLGRLKQAEWFMAGTRFDQARPLLEQLLAENRGDLQALQMMLELLQRSRNLDEARTRLDEAISRDPTSLPLLAVAAKFYNEIGDSERLVDVVKRMYDLRPNNPQMIEELAGLYIRTNRPTDAIALLEPLMAVVGERPTLGMVELLWAAQVQAENLPAAVAVIDRELARAEPLDPAQLVRRRWQALVRMKDYDQASQTLRDAMKRHPEQAANFGYELAAVTAMAGDEAGHERVLEEVLQQHPDHAPSNNDLAYTWAQQGKNLQRALAMAQAAVEGEPNNVAYLDTLGWVHYKLGQFEEAQTWLTKALQAADQQERAAMIEARRRGLSQWESLASTRAVTGDHLGDALYRLDERDKAIRAWEEALRQRARLGQAEVGSDSELADMAQRLSAKITAAKTNQPAPVASVPGAAAGDNESE